MRLWEQKSSLALAHQQYEVLPQMTSLAAKVIAIEERGDQY